MKHPRTPTMILPLIAAFLSVVLAQPALAAEKADSKDAPVKAAHVSPDYKIRAGDVLQITVWKEESLDREILVLPDGTITFPLIGSLTASGMTPTEVQSTIRTKLQGMIPDASVTVVVKATLGHSVSVIGQVQKPGEIIMGNSFSVMQALSQAGGLTPYAAEDDIIILRKDQSGKESSIAFPYDEIIKGKSLDKNIDLEPGDVIVVPTAGLF